MEAGPEMDRLVAEKVMGWFPVEDQALAYSQWHQAEKVGAGYSLPGHHNAFEPSTDIAHAWAVVERMRSFGHRSNEFVGFCACLENDCGGAMTDLMLNLAPLAICRAALKAIEA